MNLGELAARVEQLERKNRELRVMGALACVLLLAVVATPVLLPHQIPEEIGARTFRVYDENGRPRGMINADGLAYTTEDGIMAFDLVASNTSLRDARIAARGNSADAEVKTTGLRLYDLSGEAVMSITPVGIAIRGRAGKAALIPAGLLYDANGMRAMLSAEGIRADRNGNPTWHLIDGTLSVSNPQEAPHR